MGNSENQDRYSRLYLRRFRRKPRKALRIAMIAAAMAAIAFAITALGPPLPNADPHQGSSLSPAATGMTEQDIERELSESVKEGMMNVSMASTVSVDENMDARIDMVNIAQNHLNQKVVLLAADGTELFASPMVPPGKGLETARLKESVPDGISPATAVFTGYDRETGSPAGSIALEITLEKKGNHDD